MHVRAGRTGKRVSWLSGRQSGIELGLDVKMCFTYDWFVSCGENVGQYEMDQHNVPVVGVDPLERLPFEVGRIIQVAAESAKLERLHIETVEMIFGLTYNCKLVESVGESDAPD